MEKRQIQLFHQLSGVEKEVVFTKSWKSVLIFSTKLNGGQPKADSEAAITARLAEGSKVQSTEVKSIGDKTKVSGLQISGWRCRVVEHISVMCKALGLIPALQNKGRKETSDTVRPYWKIYSGVSLLCFLQTLKGILLKRMDSLLVNHKKPESNPILKL